MSRIAEILSQADGVADALGPRVTEGNFGALLPELTLVRGDDKEELKRFGITLYGRTDCEFLLSKSGMNTSNIVIHNQGCGNTVIFVSRGLTRECNITLRLQGSSCLVIFSDVSASPINLPTIYMRSDKQTFYWGLSATSVTSRIEMEGAGTMIAVGDDCMLSSGVWIRNHDMHAVFDVVSQDIVNSAPSNVIFEQHVWLGFEAFVLAAPVVGYGSILGARTLVNRSLPPKSLALGTPAKVARSGVSWSRDPSGIPQKTIELLSRLDALSI